MSVESRVHCVLTKTPVTTLVCSFLVCVYSLLLENVAAKLMQMQCGVMVTWYNQRFFHIFISSSINVGVCQDLNEIQIPTKQLKHQKTCVFFFLSSCHELITINIESLDGFLNLFFKSSRQTFSFTYIIYQFIFTGAMFAIFCQCYLSSSSNCQ